jgi:hypothetical protein
MEVKNADQAMDIAKKSLDKAEIIFYYITEAKREKEYWLVLANALSGDYSLKINPDTGEVIEFEKR